MNREANQLRLEFVRPNPKTTRNEVISGVLTFCVVVVVVFNYTFIRCALALFRLDWADEEDEDDDEDEDDAGDVLLLPLIAPGPAMPTVVARFTLAAPVTAVRPLIIDARDEYGLYCCCCCC